MRTLLLVSISLVLLATSFGHFFAPNSLAGFVPPWLPAGPVILASGLFELGLLVALWVPRTRAVAGLVFAGWCAALLPLHIWDLVRPDPMFKPLAAAVIRLVFQGVFIAMGLGVWRLRRAPLVASMQA